MSTQVAKLVIFHGAARHVEVELTGETLRIGRSVQNEIVLDDPGKGVSRTHAAIRLEGGRYTLTDLESQNGIWVSGTRVSSVFLDPEVVASVGPFRLMVEAPAPPVETHDTERIALSPPSEPIAGPVPPDAPDETTARAASRPNVPGPPRTRLRERTAARLAGRRCGRTAGRGNGVWRLHEPTEDRASLRSHPGPDDGRRRRLPAALVQHIKPALNANRNDPEALELRRRCTAPPRPPRDPPPHQPSPVTQEMDAVESLIAQNGCPEALDRINAVLAADPGNDRARELAARATACAAPAPPQPARRAPVETLAVSEPPSQGGLDALPSELQKDYLKRKQAMRKGTRMRRPA